MSVEQNKAVDRRIFEEIWNRGNLDIVNETHAADCVFHDPGPGDVVGPANFAQYVASIRAAFPDVHFTIDDQIGAGDRLATRWTATGTHRGEMMGIPATGKSATVTGIAIGRYVGGKQVESWSEWDVLGMLQQLGVAPAQGREEFGWSEPSTVTGDPGDPQSNLAIAHRYTEEVWNQGKLGVLDEIRSADGDLMAEKQNVTLYRTAFPDFHVVIEDEIAVGDKVVARWTSTGTHQGELMGAPPTGKKVAWSGITILRFADHKIVEAWWAVNSVSLMRQIGAMPGAEPSEQVSG